MRIPPGIDVPTIRPPRLLAAGIGTLVQAADVMTELGAETARTVLARSGALARRAEHGYEDAADRGELAIGQATAALSRRLAEAADEAAAWADRTFVRRLADSLTPYLIEELVPEVIDGVLPKVRADVIPVVIEDLSRDERVRSMVAQQSQDMLGWSVSEARRVCAESDNRVETALHRMLGRREPRP